MAAKNFSQSGDELRIQEPCAHESQPCWKTADQPQRRTGIVLTMEIGEKNYNVSILSTFIDCVTMEIGKKIL